MILSSKHTYHTRRVYGWLDLLGDMGGVQGALCGCISFLLIPYAEFFFLMKAIHKLYLAKTSDEDIMKRENTESHCKPYGKDGSIDSVEKKV